MVFSNHVTIFLLYIYSIHIAVRIGMVQYVSTGNYKLHHKLTQSSGHILYHTYSNRYLYRINIPQTNGPRVRKHHNIYVTVLSNRGTVSLWCIYSILYTISVSDCIQTQTRAVYTESLVMSFFSKRPERLGVEYFSYFNFLVLTSAALCVH